MTPVNIVGAFSETGDNYYLNILVLIYLIKVYNRPLKTKQNECIGTRVIQCNKTSSVLKI